MRIRTDLQYFQIPDLHFFDSGEPVKQYFDSEDDIQTGDIVEWEAGSNINGLAEVVSVEIADHDMICASLVEL